MPIEEIGEGTLRILGRIIGRIFIDCIFEFLCYYLGKEFLRVVTLGKYPQTGEDFISETSVSLVGLFLLVLIIIGMVLMTNM